MVAEQTVTLAERALRAALRGAAYAQPAYAQPTRDNIKGAGMDVSAEPSRSERTTLADGIERYQDEIEDEWLARVIEELGRHDLSDTELRDSIPDYLRGVVALLRSGQPIEGDSSSVWDQAARQHAVTRVHLGFDIDEVVKEFSVLREVLFQVMRKHGLPTEQPLGDILVDLLANAVAAAVRSYVESRDDENRRVHARHVSFITHELRNPLTIATVAGGRLIKATASLPGMKRAGELLEHNLRRLRDLIDDVLRIERLEAEEPRVDLRDVPLGDLIRDAVTQAEMAADTKGIGFRAIYDDSTVVHVDPKLTTSALQNLVDNAVKFTSEGSVELAVDDFLDTVVIHVRDHCGGLAKEEMEVMFEPFRPGRRKSAGSGLGLAIAKRAVEAHKRTLNFKSTAGEGCDFWFVVQKAAH